MKQGYIKDGCFYCKIVDRTYYRAAHATLDLHDAHRDLPPPCPKCKNAGGFVEAQMRHTSTFVPDLVAGLDALAALDAGDPQRHGALERIFDILMNAGAEGREHLAGDTRFSFDDSREEYLRLDSTGR